VAYTTIQWSQNVTCGTLIKHASAQLSTATHRQSLLYLSTTFNCLPVTTKRTQHLINHSKIYPIIHAFLTNYKKQHNIMHKIILLFFP